MSQRILVVDDSATVRAQVSAVLAPAGFQVIEAADGVEALERLAAEAVSLMILDVNMPQKNGLEVLESLPEGATVPVLVLTTEGQPEKIARARALGAKGWMVKPFRAEQLLAAARKLAR